MTTKKDRDPVSKVFAALKWLVEDSASDVGVRELAGALNVSPSSAHRLLNALAEFGFVQQDSDTARYSLGLEFIRICRIAASRMTASRVALPHMRKLADNCGETVLLCIYDADRKQMMFSDTVDALHPLRYVIELNTWQPVFAGASGQAIMAFLPPDEIEEIISGGLNAVTENTMIDPERLRASLEEIRRHGYACTRGQRIKGAVGIGAPVFGAAGEVVGDVCVTIPELRFDDAREQSLSRLVMGCANAISTDLGSNHARAR